MSGYGCVSTLWNRGTFVVTSRYYCIDSKRASLLLSLPGIPYVFGESAGNDLISMNQSLAFLRVSISIKYHE